MKEKNELAYIFNRRDKGCNVKDYTLTENSKKNNTNKNNVVLSEKEVNADSITVRLRLITLRLRFHYKITVMVIPFLISLIYNPIGYVTD